MTLRIAHNIITVICSLTKEQDDNFVNCSSVGFLKIKETLTIINNGFGLILNIYAEQIFNLYYDFTNTRLVHLCT